MTISCPHIAEDTKNWRGEGFGHGYARAPKIAPDLQVDTLRVELAGPGSGRRRPSC